jgi:hypothetical protein
VRVKNPYLTTGYVAISTGVSGQSKGTWFLLEYQVPFRKLTGWGSGEVSTDDDPIKWGRYGGVKTRSFRHRKLRRRARGHLRWQPGVYES